MARVSCHLAGPQPYRDMVKGERSQRRGPGAGRLLGRRYGNGQGRREALDPGRTNQQADFPLKYGLRVARCSAVIHASVPPGVPDTQQDPVDARIIAAYDEKDGYWKDKPAYFQNWNAELVLHEFGHSGEPFAWIRGLLIGEADLPVAGA